MPVASIRSLYEELKRRRVIRVATLYIIAFWPIVQVIDILTPALGLPETFMRNLVFVFFGGFPVVLILAWLFDVNRGGVTLDDGKAHESLISSKTELGIIGGLSLVVVGLFFVQLETDKVPAKPVVAAPSYDSIAVLPFVSFSDESRDQFFADGLTEELLNVLSRMTKLRVAARTSSFAYKGVSKNVQDIGAELGVATILEGSVRRNDINDTIRVTAQLIDVSTGSHLWSQKFEKRYTDIFKIQDEISTAVAAKLQLTLFDSDNSKSRVRIANPEAMIAYSMGQSELAKRTEPGLKDAARFFQKAIDQDSSYALAYSGKADANTLLVSYGLMDRKAGLKIAAEAVDKALALDANLGIAWASKGLLLTQEMGQKTEAIQAFEKAIELNPSYAMAFMWYAGLLEDKVKQFKFYEKAYALDPKSAVAGFNVASMLVSLGRDAEAMQVFGQIVDADPFYAGAYILVGRINDRRGRIVQAINQFEQGYDLANDASVAFDIADLYAAVRDFENSDIWYERAVEQGIPEMYASRANWLKVRRYAAAGDVDAVRPILERFQSIVVRNPGDHWDRIRASYFLGDYDEAIRFYELSVGIPYVAAHQKNSRKFRNDARIAASFSYQQLGNKKRALQIAEETGTYLDEQLREPGPVDPEDWYRKALVAAIKGEDQMALIHMQRAVDEGWREYWRPEFEPALIGLISQKPFQAMMAGLETRLDIVREQFAMEAQFATGWVD